MGSILCEMILKAEATFIFLKSSLYYVLTIMGHFFTWQVAFWTSLMSLVCFTLLSAKMLSPNVEYSEESIYALRDTCPSGKEGNVWYLGEVGIDFNSNPVSERTGFAIRAGETQTSICDENGDLLMYFDGENLYDRSHNFMEGSRVGFPITRSLNNGRSSSQSIFLKKPLSDSIYYLFFTEPATLGDPVRRDTSKRLWYSIININGNGGLGELMGQHKRLLLQPSTEKVTAIPHCNGLDYWIIGSRGNSNQFYSWLLDSDSLHQNSAVISQSGTGNNGRGAQKAGFLKPSHDGTIICEVIGYHHANLHSFNAERGVVFDGQQLISSNEIEAIYGCEFSANNSKLYFTGYSTYQMDLWAGDIDDIKNSLTLLSTTINGGAPTLGPDDRIYITKFSIKETGLEVIEFPDWQGHRCNIYNDLDIMSGTTGLGAPNFPAGFLFPNRLYTRYPDTTICMDSIAPVWVTGPCDHHNTTWQLLDGGQLNLVHEDSVELQFNRPGTYRLVAQAESRCGLRYDTIELKVRDCECTSQSGAFVPAVDTVHICDKDTVRLEHDGLHQLGPTDSLFFVLHDRSDDILGQIIAYFENDRCFYKAGLEYNRLYYFSAVTGAHQGGQILEDDPCLSVVPGIPVIFHQQPKFLSIFVPEKRCQDSCVDITIELQGNPSYLFQVRAERVVGGNVIPAEYKSTTLNSLTFSWCQDTLNLGQLTDAYCSSGQLDSTIIIEAVPNPRFVSLDHDKTICQGEFSTVSFDVQANRIVLTNQETGQSKTLSGNSVDLGPFEADSCYTMTIYNELDCSQDTSICITALPSYHDVRDTMSICQGDSIKLPSGEYISANGDYPFTMQTQAGCDSSVVWAVELTDLPTVQGLDTLYSICQGESVEINLSTDASLVILRDENDIHLDTIENSMFGLSDLEEGQCYSLLFSRGAEQCQSSASFCVDVFPIYELHDTIFKCASESVILPDGTITDQSGLYRFDLTSQSDCDSTIFIDVINNPIFSYIDTTRGTCEGQANGYALILEESGNESFEVLWSDGSAKHERSDLETGQYWVTITDEYGCKDSVLFNIETHERPNLNVTLQNETCSGQNDGWLMVSGNLNEYTLDGDLQLIGDTIFGLQPGRYSISYTDRNENCSFDTMFTIQEGEDVDVTLPPTIKLNGTSIELPLTVLNGDIVCYDWTPDYALSCTDCPRPQASPARDTTYNVKVTSENGCEANASIRVVVEQNVFVPTSFTPNGDGLNDDFRPYFSNDNQPFSLSIYNRWGELIYSCQGDPCGWDGTFNGQIVNPGVYIYTIHYSQNQSEFNQKGSVTLVR